MANDDDDEYYHPRLTMEVISKGQKGPLGFDLRKKEIREKPEKKKKGKKK